MSRQARAQLTVGGATPATGITTSSLNNVMDYSTKSNELLFSAGVAGVSVIQYSATGASQWGVEILAEIGGARYVVAGVTGIGSTTSQLIPWRYNNINVASGTTQYSFFGGIPRPTHVSVVGTSTAVGGSFGAVVTIHLWNPS